MAAACHQKCNTILSSSIVYGPDSRSVFRLWSSERRSMWKSAPRSFRDCGSSCKAVDYLRPLAHKHNSTDWKEMENDNHTPTTTSPLRRKQTLLVPFFPQSRVATCTVTTYPGLPAMAEAILQGACLCMMGSARDQLALSDNQSQR